MAAVLEVMEWNIIGHVACLGEGFIGEGNQILVYNCELTSEAVILFSKIPC
jgi:hypothetical protein